MNITPESLAAMVLSFSENISNIQLVVESNLDTFDNEMLFETLLQSYKTIINILGRSFSDPQEDILASVNHSFVSLGFIFHHQRISIRELQNIIYYIKITPDGEFHHSTFHPFFLMTAMSTHPECYTRLKTDRDYLPNVVAVLPDRDSDKVQLLSIQKANLHFDSPQSPTLPETPTFPTFPTCLD